MVELICSVDPYFHYKSVKRIKGDTLEAALIAVEKSCGYGHLAEYEVVEDREGNEMVVSKMSTKDILDFIDFQNGDGCDYIISIIHDGEVIYKG